MIDIHFPFVDARKPVLPLPAACGVGSFVETGVTARRFESLRCQAAQFFRPVPIEEAQVIFYPHCFEPCREVFLTSELARAKNIACIFVKHGDNASPVEVPYGYVYKESQAASNRLAHERVIPAFVNDPYQGLSVTPTLRSYTSRPAIGFCGFVGSPQTLSAYYLTRRKQKLAGLLLRRRAATVLSRSQGLDAKLLLRTQYWGGAVQLTRRRIRMIASRLAGRPDDGAASRDLQLEQRVYCEFVDNILGTDYTLCVRGAGNYSCRFYETLAAGRIPLFLNTDCTLPFEERIPWKKHCAWVEAPSIDELATALIGFHRSFSGEGFAKLQLANRRLYEDYLTPTNFYRLALQDAIASMRTGTMRR